MTIPRDLKRIYNEGRLIPFVGAGVSQSVTWKDGQSNMRGISWAELVDYAAREIGFESRLLRVRGSDLQVLEYVFLKEGTGFLSNWFSRVMDPPDDSIAASPIHSELVQLQLCNLVYTTNFDEFLERAYALAGKSVRRIAIEKHLAESKKEVDVVKFHGDLRHPTTMILSESDYERRLRLDDCMDHKLRSDLLGHAVLFIGYSFRDPNVAYLLRMFNAGFGHLPESGSGKRAYILVPDPSDFEQRLFNSRNIDVIGIRSSRMTDDTAQILRQLRS